MALWLLFVAMIVVAVIIVLLPLMLKRWRMPSQEGHDLVVYRDQLGELNADVERGVLSQNEVSAARLEVQRRILRSDSQQNRLSYTSYPFATLKLVVMLAIFIPSSALGLYLWWGTPRPVTENSSPHAEASNASTQFDSDIGVSIEQLSLRLEREPDDVDGWVLLGRSYMALGRYSEAVEAFQRGISIVPNNPTLLGALGEAIVFSSDGHVIPEALEIIKAALAINPIEPASLYYLGVSKLQSGDERGAFDLWIRLARNTPNDVPWLTDVIDRLRTLASTLEIDLSAYLPSEQHDLLEENAMVTVPLGEEELSLAATMTPEERREMIEGMVAQLAERLEDEPSDYAGWQRLIRSYEVLGEKEKASWARKQADKVSGLTSSTSGSGNTILGSDGTIALADRLGETSSRRQMVREMVDGLADRLKADPNDVGGWLRLSRSYEVLGDLDAARRAMRRAANLRSQDVGIQSRFAAMLIRLEEESGVVPSEALEIYGRILDLNPKHVDALFFIGLAAARSSRPKEAIATWSRLLDYLDPNGPAFIEITRRIEELRVAQ